VLYCAFWSHDAHCLLVESVNKKPSTVSVHSGMDPENSDGDGWILASHIWILYLSIFGLEMSSLLLSCLYVTCRSHHGQLLSHGTTCKKDM